jgi:hypothetical protein
MGGNNNQTKVGVGVGRGVGEATRLGQIVRGGWVVDNEKKAKTKIRGGI